MKEEEIIENVKRIIEYKVISNYINNNDSRAIQGLLDLYEKEKQENEELHKEINERIKLKIENEKIVEKDYISKDKIRDLQMQREFELQQEYKDFEDDIQWKTYKKLLE